MEEGDRVKTRVEKKRECMSIMESLSIFAYKNKVVSFQLNCITGKF